MRVAYLLSTYPTTSSTFIRDEIAALEARGVTVVRHAVRRFPGALVDPADQAELARTRYLLSGNAGGLVLAFAREALTNPAGLARTLPLWWRLYRNAGAGLTRHAAYLMEAGLLRQSLRRAGLKHLHVHISESATTVALLCHRLGGPPYSFTAHGPAEFIAPHRHSLGLKIRDAAFVVAISDYCRGVLAGIAGRAEDVRRIEIARCGVDSALFTPAPPVAAENQTFVCVGRLCPHKGQVHIPAAVARLKPRFPGLRVLLVGDGESRAAIEAEIAAHDVADEVRILGWADHAEVRRLIGASRALLLPSHAEGLPIVIMETFALGRPVISTPVAGIPELVDASCGWLVPPGDVAAMAGALEAALAASPDTLAQMGRIGRARVEARHTLARLAAQLEALFAASLRRQGEAASAPAAGAGEAEAAGG